MLTGGDSANRLAEALSRAESERTGAIVLDLTNVGHVDSTALGVLVGSMRRLHGSSRELRLVGVGPRIRLLLELTKLDALFPKHASVPDALAAEHGRASTRTEGAPLGDRNRHDV
jgi:anti-sigma B factor antagonist